MNCHTLVSVILPTYNYAHFICEAIESVLLSNFPIDEVEIIVIDDGSTDDTSERVKLYKNRVKYITQNNLGKAWATKVGIDQAKGKYIFNLDADDLFMPNKIQEVVDIFETDKDLVHVAHPAMCWNFDKNTKGAEQIPETLTGRRILGKDLLAYFYKKIGIIYGGGSTFAARAEVLKHVLIPKEVDMFIDEYLVLVTLNQGYSFFIEHPLSIWRIHEKNFSNGSETNISKVKLERNIASIDAILANLSNVGLEEELKILYQLKSKVASLAIKEKLQQKSFSDVLSLWLCILYTFSFFGTQTFGIVKNYPILNRTLPDSLLMLLKHILKKRS